MKITSHLKDSIHNATSPVDVQKLGKVAVLYGGRSAEREVSLLSGKGVLDALLSIGVDAHAFDPAERDIGELKTQQFSRCFIALHGRYGEDGTVQGALDLLGIPYTGSGVMASSIAMDKTMTKRIWRSDGLLTPDWRLVTSAKDTADAFLSLGAPIIVKPAREGSTIGLTKMVDFDQAALAYDLASKYDANVLAEQFILGDEVTCPIIGSGKGAYALPVIKIVAPEGNYDYQNKYFTDTTQYLVPCELPLKEEEAIQALVLKAYHSIGCAGWARADVMIAHDTRTPYLIEINTSPGMTGHSLVPMSAKSIGLGYAQLCMNILLSTMDGRQ